MHNLYINGSGEYTFKIGRLKMHRNIFLGLLIVYLITANKVSAAFSDDFSDEAASSLNWISVSDSVRLTFTKGSCTVENKSGVYAGIVAHQLPQGEWKSTFTLSGKVTLADNTMSAGLVCCLTVSGYGHGYYIAISGDKNLSVTKITASGEGKVLFNSRNPYFTTGANELKVSKKGDLFNIFCNGRFVGKFNDNTFSSGDIALLVSAKTTATFDDIVMIDSFEEGVPPTCFADDFDAGLKAEWSWFGDAGAKAYIDKNALRITTADKENIYMLIDLPLKQFVMKAVVSQHGGKTQGLYGLFICGKAEEGATIPLAGFGINGGRNFGVFSTGQTITLNMSSSIKGAPYVSSTGDTTYYKDTIEVIKREDVPQYLFVVNGDTLSRFTGVNFSITGAGLFCLDNLDVVFDDFIVAEDTNAICRVSDVKNINPTIVKSASAHEIDMRIFDLSGRLLFRDKRLGDIRSVSGVCVYAKNNLKSGHSIFLPARH